ncbi:MAG TPA: hypothetical protein PK079_16245 [Leptospiraceae bacterium]|nr:hypothetical protein [Leptospiraceae bacterium]HMW07050.1 hypothetical protein [Leptospiraceae bacterium]HMX32753.1 hypothetical protein [Leptospiraceae bacterium]HMY33855.1 hypothetical protein [Leptospiraceae bacterium]HMZ66809.1 hypothetical protein [Leptospiraceae bacterium]
MHNRLVFLFLFLFITGLNAEELNLKISLKNGTTGGVGQADSIKLIALQGGMVPVGEFSNKSGNFVLEKVNVPDGSPILIQVSYKGANYNKMVPPAPNFRNKVQEISVYETTSDRKNIEVRSLLQIVREENLVRLYKIFLIENKSNPPRSFQDKNNPLEVFVPAEATEVFGQLTQGDSKMGIPLNLVDGKKGKMIDRSILPGSSELQITFVLSAKSLGDISFKDELNFEDPKSPRIIFYKPKDMKVELKGSMSTEEIKENIPEGLGAIRAIYSETNSVEISVAGGNFEPEEPRTNSPKVRNGSIFTTWDKSVFAVIGFLGIFFSLSFLFVYRK